MSDPVLCFGEVLWDCLPRGLFLGGAPMNVAFHLQQLGRDALPVSAVGRDFLGEEIHRRLAGWGIDGRFVPAIDAPTGVVQVELQDGQPSYEIVDHVAWDAIPGGPDLRAAASAAPALVYGSLASRHRPNRDLLLELIAACPGLTVFDVNLRPPFDDLDLVREIGRHSDVLKLNGGELERLVGSDGDLEAAARRLAEDLDCRMVCATAGADGAGLLAGDWHWVDGRSITVKDAVGAGDSFTAALLDGLLADAPHERVLERAARLAEFVAGSDGATPDHAEAQVPSL